MSFTFNWAGINFPQAQRQDAGPDPSVVAANFGAAAAGYRQRKGAQEYADLIKNYGKPTDRQQALVQELNQLKARNAEIAKILGI